MGERAEELDWEEIFKQMSSCEVGRRINERRIGQGMSIDEFAKYINRSISTVNRIEKGKHDINIEQLYLISEVLQVNYSELIFD